VFAIEAFDGRKEIDEASKQKQVKIWKAKKIKRKKREMKIFFTI
jgi:hypothetical protein